MAVNPIKYSELVVDDGGIQKAIESIVKFEKIYIDAVDEIKKRASELKADAGKLSPSNEQDRKKIEELTQSMNKLKKQHDALIKTKKVAGTTSKKLNDLTFNERKQRIAQMEATKRQNKALRDLVKTEKVQAGSIQELIIKTNRLNKSRQNLDLRTKQGQKEYQRMTNKINANTDSLKKHDAAIGRSHRNVGNYKSALQSANNVISQFGIGLGIAGGVRLMGNVLNVVRDFDQAVADLGAISGKTAGELKVLNDQAKELGATTQFTASEATALQTELAKLGFSIPEIEQSTASILDFAAATGADLPSAAKVAGSALRAFQLPASEMQNVVSTLGVATTKTALDFGALETGLSTVAPVAKAFGFSVEDTTALLGQLANSGFDASSSATATRNILLKLADANGDLAKQLGRPIKSADDLSAGLQELQAKGINLSEALELTDKRSVAAFQTFIDGSDSLVDLRDSITGVNSELTDMAEKRLDTVNGKLQLLNSAWQGYIINLSESADASSFLKSVIEFLANNIDVLLGMIPRIIGYFVLWRIRTQAAAAANFIFNGGLSKMINGIPAMIRGLKSGTTAVKGFGSAMKRIPFVAIIAGLTEVVMWLYRSSDAADESTEAEKKRTAQLEEEKRLQEDMNRQLENATGRFVSLIEQLKQTNKQSEDRERLIKLINKEYGTTLQNIQDEAKFMDQLTLAVDNYIKSKKEEILLKQNETEIGKLLVEQIEIEKSLEGDREAAFNRGKMALKKQLDMRLKLGGSQEQYEHSLRQLGEVINMDHKYAEQVIARGRNETITTTSQIARLKEIKRLLAILAGENLNLLETEENLTEEMDGFGGSTDKTTNKAKKLKLEIKEINKLLREGRYSDPELLKTQEQINEEELKQETEKIERALIERQTAINDAEREGILSAEDAANQRLIAEIDSLNTRKHMYELYGVDVIDIENKLSEKKLQLSKTLIEKENQLKDEALARDKQRMEEMKQAIQEFTDFAAKQAFEQLNKTQEEKKEKQEEEIEGTKTQIEKQQELAEDGLSNSLAFEEAALAEQQARLQEIEKQQQRLKKLEVLYDLTSSYAQSGADNPLSKALADMAKIEGIAAVFGDGGVVEDKLPSNGIFKGDSHRAKSGGIPIKVEGQEGIFSVKEMMNFGKTNFYKLKDTLGRGPIGGDLFNSDQYAFVSQPQKEVVPDNSELIHEIKNLRKDVKSKESLTDVKIQQALENYVDIITTKVEGNKTTSKTKRVRI
ncbi:MAG: phage tail tape measure protein [Candidatus Babeliales bacterium]